jgi:hypothetical protein
MTRSEDWVATIPDGEEKKEVWFDSDDIGEGHQHSR